MDNESQKIITWLKISATIFLCIGMAFSLGIWMDYSKIKEVQKWPLTEGHIVMHREKTNDIGQMNQSIRYQYSVNGKDFESTKVNPNQFTQGKEDFFKVKKDNKIVVFVHYNKSIPSEGYLVVEWSPFVSTHFYYAVSSVLFATIFGIILFAIKIKQSKCNKKKNKVEVSS